MSALLVVVVALLCLGDVVSAAFDGGSTESTTAASERYAVVRYREPTLFASDRDTLYLRTRSWLLSYEGDTEFACFMDESSGAGPEWLFDHVNATDVDTLHVVAKDGTAWDIRFDPRTLRPLNPLDRCTEAPDPGAD